MEIVILKASQWIAPNISTGQLLSKCHGPAAHTILHFDLQALTMATQDAG